MISMICVSCSMVILDMLNTFLKNYNYFKLKLNNILSIIYKNNQNQLVVGSNAQKCCFPIG